MVGGGEWWWWLRPILLFSLGLDQAEQNLVKQNLANKIWEKIMTVNVIFAQINVCLKIRFFTKIFWSPNEVLKFLTKNLIWQKYVNQKENLILWKQSILSWGDQKNSNSYRKSRHFAFDGFSMVLEILFFRICISIAHMNIFT